jgi:hypothetical protein
MSPSGIGSHSLLLEAMREGSQLPEFTARLLKMYGASCGSFFFFFFFFFFFCSLLTEPFSAEVPGLSKKPILKQQKVANINKCFAALRDNGCPLGDVNASLFYDGEPGEVLGVIWQLFQHYHLHETNYKVTSPPPHPHTHTR